MQNVKHNRKPSPYLPMPKGRGFSETSMIEARTCPVCNAQVPAVLNESTQEWILVEHYVTADIVMWRCPGEKA